MTPTQAAAPSTDALKKCQIDIADAPVFFSILCFFVFFVLNPHPSIKKFTNTSMYHLQTLLKPLSFSFFQLQKVPIFSLGTKMNSNLQPFCPVQNIRLKKA